MRVFDWFRSVDLVSDAWLKEQQRQESRIEFHGVRWQFPIKKLLNESDLWNRHQEQQRRKQA